MMTSQESEYMYRTIRPVRITNNTDYSSREGFNAFLSELVANNKHLIGNIQTLRDAPFHVRACGRSTLLALSYIKQAMEDPGKPVSLLDHWPSDTANKFLLNLTERIICQYDVLSEQVPYFNFTRTGRIQVVSLEFNPLKKSRSNAHNFHAQSAAPRR
jgi:hypothetical protein